MLGLLTFFPLAIGLIATGVGYWQAKLAVHSADEELLVLGRGKAGRNSYLRAGCTTCLWLACGTRIVSRWDDAVREE